MKNFSLIFSLVFFTSNVMANSFLETDFNQNGLSDGQVIHPSMVQTINTTNDIKLELSSTEEDVKIQALLNELKAKKLENKDNANKQDKLTSSEKYGSFLELDFGNNHVDVDDDVANSNVFVGDEVVDQNMENTITQAADNKEFVSYLPFESVQQNNNPSGWTCWDNAGSIYGVDPWLLMAYAKVESSFRENAINKNTNKSTDIGMMQINSIHLPKLAKHGISKSQLYDACTSIHIGAWIAADNIKRFGYNIDGIGAYNSPGNPKIRRAYGAKVIEAYNVLIKKYAKY